MRKCRSGKSFSLRTAGSLLFSHVNLTKKEVKFFTGEETEKILELVTKSTSECLC